MNALPWYALNSTSGCISPSLLVYPDRIAYNIGLMIRIAGGTEYLRPHVKTHKMAEVILMQLEAGIRKFKCATIAEAELLGSCGAADVLIALQAVGPNLERFLQLQDIFPKTFFSTIVDDPEVGSILNQMAGEKGSKALVYMDINVGMNRTGISPDTKGYRLFKELCSLPNLKVKGFHVYDGHIRHPDPAERAIACDTAFSPVLDLKGQLESEGYRVKGIVAGGSPSFPLHARRNGVETSPGTTLLWDENYAETFPDMPFLPAAVLLSRIISKPGERLLCLDLGHKAVAPEMPFPRVRLLGMEECEQLSQSEEHLVVQCPSTETYRPGDACYALPMHICPTVAKYPAVYTVKSGELTGSWRVAARDHRISI
jgi:D-serine deaminase-like pyridoxal phosphate-dependent protein